MSTTSVALPGVQAPAAAQSSALPTARGRAWRGFQRGVGWAALLSGFVAAALTGLEASTGLGKLPDALIMGLLGLSIVSAGEGLTLLVWRLVGLGVRLAGRLLRRSWVLRAGPLDPKELGRLLGALFLAGCDRWLPFAPFANITIAPVVELYMPFIWLSGGLLGLAWPPGAARGPLSARQGWLLAAAALLNVVPLGWAAWPGTTAGLATAELIPAQGVAPLALADPGQAGPLAVGTLTYGSGTDRRAAFGRDAALTTPTVDGYDIFHGPAGFLGDFQRWTWGFDMHALPLNGRVWYPQGGRAPYPLVLIVHGNHAAGEASDPGYAYLAEHLATWGYIAVSVDENFLNGGFLGPVEGEMPVRAWLLLKHLQQWRAWNAAPGNPFFGQVDLERVGLVGHSRGGEAVVHAAELNAHPHAPVSNVEGADDFGFGIRGVVALGPCDGQYQPAGLSVTLRNASYLLLNGGHDGDTHTPYGLQQYNRVKFDENPNGFKAFVYLYRANHGQFNTVWADTDVGPLKSTLLNRAPYLRGAEQRQAARVLITAFMEAAVRDQAGYRAVFYQPDAALGWLPDDLYLTQYQDAGFQALTTFDTGRKVEALEGAGGTATAEGMTWAKAWLDLRDGETPQHNAVARLAWPAGGEAVLTLAPAQGGWPLAAASALQFDLGVLEDLPAPAAVYVEAVDAAGQTARLPLSAFGSVHPRLPVKVMKWDWLSDLLAFELKTVRPSEDLLQTYVVPLAALVNAAPNFDASDLREVRLVFATNEAGGVMVDEVGVVP